MRVAVISDVHGNLPALRAVIQDVLLDRPDLLVSCGDIASGPLPNETIEHLLDIDLPLVSVRGNADRGAVDSHDGSADPSATHEDDIWTGQQLTREHRDLLAGLPLSDTLDIPGLGRVLFCHATPRRDDEIVISTTEDERLRTILAEVAADVVVCGNTHMQFDRRIDDIRLVNVGSVGWPYGDPGAYWALLGPDVDLRRTGYDLEAAAEELSRRSNWPRVNVFAESLAAPPPTSEALDFFARLEAEQWDDRG